MKYNDPEAVRARIELATKRPSKWAKYRIRPDAYPSTPGNKRYEQDRKAGR